MRLTIGSAIVFILLVFPRLLGAQCVMPEMISGKAIFSPRCGLTLYSSNHSGPIRPYLYHDASGVIEALPLDPESQDFFARDISADCRWVALVGDHEGNEQYQVFLYDRQAKTRIQISKKKFPDAGSPMFSPDGKFLAYSAGNRIAISSLSGLISGHTSQKEIRAKGRVQSFVWAADSKSILYQDEGRSISRYDVKKAKSEILWQSPRPSSGSSQLFASPDALYFLSDHQSDFSQIYRLRLGDKSVQLANPQLHDQSDPQVVDGKLWDRVSMRGKFCLEAEDGSPLLRQLRCNGVVYNYQATQNQLSLIYSSLYSPVSLFVVTPAAEATEKLKIHDDRSVTEVREIPSTNPDLPHFLFLPKMQTKKLVLWLHGGPFENVSPRYNPFIANIVRQGQAVLALNYLGSTGAGNSYEHRELSGGELLRAQLLDVDATWKRFRKENPQFAEFSILGVSYGANLAHEMLERHPEEFSKLVDFSGKNDLTSESVSALKIPTHVPTLFIAGENDQHSFSPERQQLLARYRDTQKMSELRFPEEGHVIRSRAANEQICSAIVNFLNQE